MKIKLFNMQVYYVLSVLFSLTLIVTSFNIETRQQIVKSVGEDNIYFGFSVAMHKVQPKGGEKWLLVGAPLGHNLQPQTNRTGALFKCKVNNEERDCEQVVTDGIRVEDYGLDRAELFPPGTDEIKEDQWMGATVKSQGPGGKVIVCAHRYITSENIERHQNGFGLCYLMTNELKLEEDLQPCKGKPVERLHQQFGVCQAGTSVDVLDNGIALIGAPGPYTWRGTIFSKTVVGDFIERDANTYMGPLEETSLPIDKYSYVGMSVTGGKFSDKNEFLYASGAHRSNLTGQVYIFQQIKDNTQLKIIKVINGFKFASSFGYEILSEDINNDGYDDLIVAAPFYFDNDEVNKGGRIYVYLNLKDCLDRNVECKPNQVITGRKFSRFGFSLTSLGDINKDGINDIAVGAPYESLGPNTNATGAVYIYLGSPDGLNEKESQKIIHKRVRTFGYSLSGGLDMDDNDYPDLLIGAYESDVALLYKSRQIIDINISIKDDEMKNINATKKGCRTKPDSTNNTCFSFQACLSFTGQTKTGSFNVTYKLQENSTRKRVWIDDDSNVKKSTKQRIITITDVQTPVCIEETVFVEEFVRDFLKPLQFVINCSLVDDSPYSRILNKTSVKRFAATFQKDCGSDDICNSSLQLNAIPLDLPPRVELLNNLPVYIAESVADEVRIQVNVKNLDEPAYETKLFIEHPEELSYIALQASKNDSNHARCTSMNKTLITCDLGNPMKKNQHEKPVLRFEIYRKAKPELRLAVFVNTTSNLTNARTKEEFYIVLEKRAKFSLTSKRTTNLYFGGDNIRGESAMQKLEDIGPRVTHQFTIENSGKWAISNFNLTILWPYQIYNVNSPSGKWILYLEDYPKLAGYNTGSSCTVDLNLINPLNLASNEIDEPENLIAASNRMKRSVRTKRDVEAIIKPTTKTKNDKKYSVIEIDCFSNTAKCAQINCKFNELPPGGLLSVNIRSRLWNSTFTEDYSGVHWISITSFANVTVGSEFTLDNQTQSYVSAETVVYSVPPQSMNYWWIIIAVICGLVVLIVITFILYKCGFFKRNRLAKDKTLTGNLIAKDESKELLNH